jgi:hypothetical protein
MLEKTHLLVINSLLRGIDTGRKEVAQFLEKLGPISIAFTMFMAYTWECRFVEGGTLSIIPSFKLETDRFIRK